MERERGKKKKKLPRIIAHLLHFDALCLYSTFLLAFCNMFLYFNASVFAMDVLLDQLNQQRQQNNRISRLSLYSNSRDTLSFSLNDMIPTIDSPFPTKPVRTTLHSLERHCYLMKITTTLLASSLQRCYTIPGYVSVFQHFWRLSTFAF